MQESVDARFEAVARKAGHIQDAVDRVRARAVADGVSVEVGPDGRIIDLVLPDAVLAQSVSRAHERARGRALEQAAVLRRELTADPVVAAALRRFLLAAPGRSNTGAPQQFSGPRPVDVPNPYALPPAVRQRYGLA
ncbi:hypothetical protein ACQP1O_02565 [Nocardia sp. CA-151230]|uniref:hypothetical protein n=1 Tax=Nocardia sp. CA-151230 TaxID=3239982 RepID=UPI003D93E95B